MKNINESFEKLVNEMFFNHKGVLVERSGSRFIWKGKLYDSIEELDAALEQTFNSIKNSIK